MGHISHGLDSQNEILADTKQAPTDVSLDSSQLDTEFRHRSKASPATVGEKKKLPTHLEEQKQEKSVKVKTKRSFRDFFHMREAKRTEKVDKCVENKRSSITTTGSTLAKRFRNSTNFSKPHQPKTSQVELKPVSSQFEHTPREVQNTHCAGPDATCSDTTAIVSKIVDRVSSYPENSPDRLRSLEIAEVYLSHNLKRTILTK